MVRMLYLMFVLWVPETLSLPVDLVFCSRSTRSRDSSRCR